MKMVISASRDVSWSFFSEWCQFQFLFPLLDSSTLRLVDAHSRTAELDPPRLHLVVVAWYLLVVS